MKKSKKTTSPLAIEMKKRRREKNRREAGNALFEGVAELFIYVLFFAVGLGVFALVGAEIPEDPELIALVGIGGLLAVGLLIAGLVTLVKRKGKTRAKGNNAPTLPRTFKNLQSLYDELAGSITPLSLADFEIRVEYGGSTLAIREKASDLFILTVDGEALSSAVSGEEAYLTALNFAHELRCDGLPATVDDGGIIFIRGGLVAYRDYFGRRHRLVLKENAEGFVGSVDVDGFLAVLHGEGYDIEIEFNSLRKSRGHFLFGWRRERITKFGEEICSYGRLYGWDVE